MTYIEQISKAAKAAGVKKLSEGGDADDNVAKLNATGVGSFRKGRSLAGDLLRTGGPGVAAVVAPYLLASLAPAAAATSLAPAGGGGFSVGGGVATTSAGSIYSGLSAAGGGIGRILSSVLGGGYEKRYPMDEKLPSKTAPTGGGPFNLPGGTPPIVDPGGGADDNPFKGSGLATAIGVGGNLLSGWLGARAASNAQKAQVAAAEQQQKNLQPWVNAGTTALTDIQKMLGDPNYSWNKEFVAPDPQKTLENPAVKFQLEQGRKLLEAGASMRGTIFSGDTLRAVDEYGQGVASQEYDKLYGRAQNEYRTAYDVFANERSARLNPLQSLAGIGQTATRELNTAQGEIGDAQAAGAIGGSNQWKSAIDNITKQLMDASMIFRQSSYAGAA